jgi:hypothetical protein
MTFFFIFRGSNKKMPKHPELQELAKQGLVAQRRRVFSVRDQQVPIPGHARLRFSKSPSRSQSRKRSKSLSRSKSRNSRKSISYGKYPDLMAGKTPSAIRRSLERLAEQEDREYLAQHQAEQRQPKQNTAERERMRAALRQLSKTHGGSWSGTGTVRRKK